MKETDNEGTALEGDNKSRESLKVNSGANIESIIDETQDHVGVVGDIMDMFS